MSLQLAAQHLASRGRGPDTQLVHMAPNEVAGLHALALAHGGTLTTNPDTGLPEAGFLKKILPMLIGAGLSIASGGTLTPLMAAGITGAGYGVAKGSLKEGLMAGLGAYGGAGLGSGLIGVGAAEAAVPGAAAVAPGAPTVFPTDPSAYGNFAPTDANFGAFGEARGALSAMPPTTGNPSMFGAMTDAAGQPLNFDPLNTAAPAARMSVVPPTTISPATLSPAYGTEAAKAAAQEQAANATIGDRFSQAGRSISSLFDSQSARDAFLGQAGTKTAEATGVGGLSGLAKYGLAAAAPLLESDPRTFPEDKGSGPNPYSYSFERGEASPFPTPSPTGIEQLYFPNARYKKLGLAEGGPVESMSNANALGANTGFPMANIHQGAYAVPYQQPISSNVVSGTEDSPVDPYTGQERLAAGGISHLGDYSDGGRLLRGPGDGVSDSIPATIANKRPARLADGEFVVPARIVSELGNGSTEAGARKLYAMLDRVQKARGKTTGKGRVAVNNKAESLMPA